jgi:hypothetical protein
MPTPYEYLMANAQYINGFSRILRDAFIFFCKTDISFLFDERKIIIGDIEELVQTMTSVEDLVYLTEEEFFDF